MERELAFVNFHGFLRLRPRQDHDFSVQFHGLIYFLLRDWARLILQVHDLGLQKRPLLVQLQNLEGGPPPGDDVHAAVGIFLRDRENLRGASDLGELLLLASKHAKILAVIETFGDHFTVARLENMQRQRRAGEQNDVQRKQWQQWAQ